MSQWATQAKSLSVLDQESQLSSSHALSAISDYSFQVFYNKTQTSQFLFFKSNGRISSPRNFNLLIDSFRFLLLGVLLIIRLQKSWGGFERERERESVAMVLKKRNANRPFVGGGSQRRSVEPDDHWPFLVNPIDSCRILCSLRDSSIWVLFWFFEGFQFFLDLSFFTGFLVWPRISFQWFLGF